MNRKFITYFLFDKFNVKLILSNKTENNWKCNNQTNVNIEENEDAINALSQCKNNFNLLSNHKC